MIERLIPIFAVIGVLSSIGYLSLMVWVMYNRLDPRKTNHQIHHH
ncbi:MULTISPECIES: hypothetical protein [Neisseria]|nr:hypothetical protein [Neisseria arctica]